MTTTLQKPAPLWIACPATDLCPGDAIRISRSVGLLTGRLQTNGRPEYVTEAAGLGRYPNRPVRSSITVRLSGRVLDVVDRASTTTRPAGRYIRVEWIGAVPPVDPRADLPVVWHPYDEPASSLDAEGVDLCRARTEGPEDRNRSAGLAWLRDRLVAACGDRDPVEALARCVDPREVRRRLPGKSLEGRHLFTVGAGEAQDVLDGLKPTREWMIRQVDGRMPVPEAHHLDDFDPVEVAAHLYPAGSVEHAEIADAEAIQETLPGAVVAFVRPVSPTPSETVNAAPTPPPAPLTTPFKVDPSVYAQPDEDDLVYG